MWQPLKLCGFREIRDPHFLLGNIDKNSRVGKSVKAIIQN